MHIIFWRGPRKSFYRPCKGEEWGDRKREAEGKETKEEEEEEESKRQKLKVRGWEQKVGRKQKQSRAES